MKFLEAFDKNNLPIFEGDTLFLNLNEISFGSSFLGSLCDMYKVDSIEIEILDNGKYIHNKFIVSFYKEKQQIITEKEYHYWDYINNSDKNKPLKTIEEFNDVENPNDLFVSKLGDNIFFRYLLSKDVEKISGSDITPIKLQDSDFLIKTDSDLEITLKDSVVFDIPDMLKKQLDVSLQKKEILIKDEYSHLTFVFKKRKDFFDFYVEILLTNKEGEPVVFEKKLNQLGEEELKKLNNEEKEESIIYSNDKYIYLNAFQLFIGFNKEVLFFNSLISKGFEPNKL